MSSPRGNYFTALPARVAPEMLDALQAHAPPALRWFHPDDLHLTLAFFGREDPKRIPAILNVLQKIPFAQCEVTCGNLRLLPRPNRFTAVSFELREGREAIADLISTWRNPLLEAAGCQPDHRPPLPHLTIARPIRKHPEFQSQSIIHWTKSLPPPSNPISILPPALYGWSPDRPIRQFQIIKPPVLPPEN